MKVRNTQTKLITMAIAIAVLATAWSAWGPRRAEAVIAIIRTTGMFSLAQGQGSSAHVVNTWGGDEIVNWRVLDSAGNTLAQSDRLTLGMGRASSFDFIPNDGDIPEGGRLAIRFELSVEGADRNKPSFIATQEVFNVGDGKTTVFLPYIEQ